MESIYNSAAWMVARKARQFKMERSGFLPRSAEEAAQNLSKRFAG
jgi:hypothetical protein